MAVPPIVVVPPVRFSPSTALFAQPMDPARIARNAWSEGRFSLEIEAKGDENLLRWRGKRLSEEPKWEIVETTF